jgi:hypothetical protein
MGARRSRDDGGPRRTGRGLILGLAAAVLLVLPAGVGADSATCVVTLRGTHSTFATLQAALDASPAGATLLARGTCRGGVVVAKNVTIRGSQGDEDEGSGELATLEGAQDFGVNATLAVRPGVTARIERLIIRSFFGGLINEGVLVLRRSLVTNSGMYPFPPAVRNLADLTVLDSTIDRNQNSGISNAGTLLVKDSSITRNFGRLSLGLGNGGTATLIRTTVSDNVGTIPHFGGGISNGGTLTLIDSEVSRNQATVGAGIFNRGTVTLIHSRVKDNLGTGVSNGSGHPLFFQLPAPDARVVLISSTVTGNSGGGVSNNAFLTLRGRTRIGANTPVGIFNMQGATVVGLTRKTFTPPNIPDQCIGCPPVPAGGDDEDRGPDE